MKVQKNNLKSICFAVAMVATAILFIVLLVCFKQVYCLNDDVMIQSILSGQVSGTAEGRAVYFSVPFSSLLALLYQFLPGIPWFGVTLTGCFILCYFLLLYTTLVYFLCERKMIWQMGSIVLLSYLLFMAILFGQFLMPHYTVVAALCGATALYLLILTKQDLKHWWMVIGLMLLCYLIRTQVFFMLLPFFGLCGLYCMLRERSIRKYLKPIGILSVGILVLWGIGKLSYQDAEWKEYLSYNAARTELYDYALLWETEEAFAYYQNLGYTEAELNLYLNYDVILDDRLNSDKYYELAEYAKVRPEAKDSFGTQLKNAVWLYRQRLMDGLKQGDVAILLTGTLYGILLLFILAKKQKQGLFAMLLLLGARSFVELYLLFRGRYPERVLISIMLMEMFVLLAFLLENIKNFTKDTPVGNKHKMVPAGEIFWGMKKAGSILAVIILGVVAIEGIAMEVPNAIQKAEQQIQQNTDMDRLYQYMAEHPMNHYLVDVYGVVNRTEMVYDTSYREETNYLLLGGWMAGSPLLQEKLATWGYSSAMDALLSGEDTYAVLREQVGLTVEELSDFCTERSGERVSFTLVDEIISEGGNYYIYQREEQ